MPVTIFPPRIVEYCPDPRWPWNPMWKMTVAQAGKARSVRNGDGEMSLEFDFTAAGATKCRFGLRRWWRWLWSVGPLRDHRRGGELRG